MKRTASLIVIAVLVLIFLGLSVGPYNSMVERQEQVRAQWSQVENVYQRRADLIPNVVATVKGAADFEQETLTAITEARSRAMAINISGRDIPSPEQLQEFATAQQALGQTILNFRAVAEAYPQLQATQAYRDLIVELEGSENRIAVERRNYAQVVQAYNSYIRKFPQMLTARLFGFERVAYFEADNGSDKAPEVSFD